jgi:hypothetical protein
LNQLITKVANIVHLDNPAHMADQYLPITLDNPAHMADQYLPIILDNPAHMAD